MDLAKIKQGSNIVIIGARNTGKSTLVKEILKYFPSNGTIVCGSEEWNPIYGGCCKHTEYSRTLVSTAKNFLVLDDCIYDPGYIHEVFEHKKAPTLIITMLYAMCIPPEVHIDYVFIFREPIQSNQRKLYDRYASSAFADFESFCQALQMNEYDCLVIENKTTAYYL
jgi:ABC-type transport system involved in cytochrome bd biosynthesis fused ATPase/permease subunit